MLVGNALRIRGKRKEQKENCRYGTLRGKSTHSSWRRFRPRYVPPQWFTTCRQRCSWRKVQTLADSSAASTGCVKDRTPILCVGPLLAPSHGASVMRLQAASILFYALFWNEHLDCLISRSQLENRPPACIFFFRSYYLLLFSLVTKCSSGRAP